MSQDPESTETSTTGTVTISVPTTPATEIGSQPSAEPNVDWQAKYQGLQRAFQKAKDSADTQIKDLQAKIAEATAQMEAAYQDATGKEQQRVALETSKSQLEQTLQQAQAERDALNAKLSRQSILLKEFPTLAPMADYIPPADTDENFRVNATNFSEALKAYIENAVRDRISGAAPTTKSGSEEIPSSSEEDRLWGKVYSLAGIPEREAEFNEANRQLQQLLATKNQ